MDYLNPPVDDYGKGKMNQEALTSRLTPAYCFLPETRTSEVEAEVDIMLKHRSYMEFQKYKKEDVAFFGCNPICSHFCGSQFVFGHLVSLLANFWYALILIQA